MMSWIDAIFIVCAYLIGSTSSAILVCKLWRLPDPRTQGSKNPGATNVLRIGGKVPAIITLFGDVLKGTLPVGIALLCGLSSTSIALVAFAAFLGHLYPIFFRFQGGKGVATAIGIWLAISLWVSLAFFLTWLIVVAAFRYVSLASMVASLFVPLFIFIFDLPIAYFYLSIVIAILLLYRHRSNIVKLYQGKENKLSFKKQKA